VPYRAKDVPAERAQYAHPDIYILLTHLSYYYSGLNNSHLDQVFEKLKKSSDASFEYKSWIDTLPKDCSIDDSIKEYSGINLYDSTQKYDLLYPVLKYHPDVINYWLSEFLFPKEAKQFHAKLETSAWDLCQIKKYPLSGFSGTNDSRLLLPLTTHYHEIPDLKGTNGMLLDYLLREENRSYTFISSDNCGKFILKSISSSESDLRLLLDVGALMLEYNNQQVIEEWMKLRRDVEAGIFFDENNRLSVIDRRNNKTYFEISPYRKKIEKCVVYFDESHTRGTDIKFPYGTIGAVTLGKGVTKDRLMQGCMRLRLLGKGHSVRFFASFEVNQNILNMKHQHDSQINTIDILKWVLNNTRKQTIDGYLYWAQQGLSLFRRESICLDYENDKQLKKYADNTIDYETIELKKLYDPDRIEDTITNIIYKKSEFIGQNLSNVSLFYEKYKEKAESIHSLLLKYASTETTFSHLLEEEQELELEIEQEQEKETERPPSAKPLKNLVEPDVERFIKSGDFNKNSKSFIKLIESLNESSLRNILQPFAWSDQLFVTRDFTKTVSNNLNEIDDYLRPPRWFSIHGKNENMIIVFLSDYEANELFAHFNPNVTSLATFLPRLREGQDRILSFPKVDIPSYLEEQLAVFTGSLFFNKNEEQDDFVRFVGYCPSPRSHIQQIYFENEIIFQNGFVAFENRKKVFRDVKLSNFQEDPCDLLTKLYELRNYGIVPRSAHHLKILRLGRRNEFITCSQL
jgi:hypothetical protein